jgi:hypothetical protein
VLADIFVAFLPVNGTFSAVGGGKTELFGGGRNIGPKCTNIQWDLVDHLNFPSPHDYMGLRTEANREVKFEPSRQNFTGAVKTSPDERFPMKISSNVRNLWASSFLRR